RRDATENLGVTESAQASSVAEAYGKYGIDADAIVSAGLDILVRSHRGAPQVTRVDPACAGTYDIVEGENEVYRAQPTSRCGRSSRHECIYPPGLIRCAIRNRRARDRHALRCHRRA